MLAKVYVTLKKGVHDQQGEAVMKTLGTMGYKEVSNVRIGKYIEVKLADVKRDDANARLTEMCEKLLSNTVIESYRFEIDEKY